MNALSERYQAKIKAYIPRQHAGFRQKLAFFIKKIAGQNEFGVYKSFGASEFFSIKISKKQNKKAIYLFDSIINRLNCTNYVENIIINGVLIGDLIYDSYLMGFGRPTIDVKDREFRRFLLESLESFVFWEDYLNGHDVRAINVSHCVYNLAMPLRLAVARGIPVYQANITHLYHMTERNLFAYNDFFHFPERFAALPRSVQEAGLAEAQRRIERRFAGEVGVDMAYSTKSAYGRARHVRLLRESTRKKVLIATHCFFDSPHSYGNNIFPDFYEWLDFLGKMTEVTDYDWYIKTHPDFLPGTKEIIDGFIARYPKFTLLPADSSHHQIIAEGIDLALTVYGTIAFEYAALGIPVVNASQNNPHIAYDFNLHAADAEDYRRMIINIDSIKLRIEKKKIYEYYFMKYIYNTENLFFENYDDIMADLGGYDRQFTPDIYDRWLKDWSLARHGLIIEALQAFIRSGDFRMDYTHYGRDFVIEAKGEQG